MRVPPHNDDAVAPCSGLRFSAVLHGESSKRLATPRNTKSFLRYVASPFHSFLTTAVAPCSGLCDACVWLQKSKSMKQLPVSMHMLIVPVLMCSCGWFRNTQSQFMVHLLVLSRVPWMMSSVENPGLSCFLWETQNCVR